MDKVWARDANHMYRERGAEWRKIREKKNPAMLNGSVIKAESLLIICGCRWILVKGGAEKGRYRR